MGNVATIWIAAYISVICSVIQSGWSGRLCTIKKGYSEAISLLNRRHAILKFSSRTFQTANIKYLPNNIFAYNHCRVMKVDIPFTGSIAPSDIIKLQLATPSVANKIARYPEKTDRFINELYQVKYAR